MIKVNSKDTRTTSIVNFEHILHFILLLILLNSNKKVSVGSEKWSFQTINLFLVTVRNKSPMSWENLMCYMFSSSFTQHKVMKEYIFMTGLQKDKSNPVFSCVRTDVKI